MEKNQTTKENSYKFLNQNQTSCEKKRNRCHGRFCTEIDGTDVNNVVNTEQEGEIESTNVPKKTKEKMKLTAVDSNSVLPESNTTLV